MPSPRPMRRHLERSAAVPWASLGNHARGTASVRPSLRSTTSASLVTRTSWARTGRASTAEERMPLPQKHRFILPDQRFHPVDLRTTEPTARIKPHRVQPELRAVLVALDMHVRRFLPVPREIEEAVWATSEDRRHRAEVYTPLPVVNGILSVRCWLTLAITCGRGARAVASIMPLLGLGVMRASTQAARPGPRTASPHSTESSPGVDSQAGGRG